MAAFPQSPGRITQIFLTYLKTLGDIYLALNAARLLSDNLSLSRAPVARRPRRPASVAKKLHFSLEISIYMFQQNKVSMEIFQRAREEGGKKNMERCRVDQDELIKLCTNSFSRFII